jgi:hypothetical protein
MRNHIVDRLIWRNLAARKHGHEKKSSPPEGDGDLPPLRRSPPPPCPLPRSHRRQTSSGKASATPVVVALLPPHHGGRVGALPLSSGGAPRTVLVRHDLVALAAVSYGGGGLAAGSSGGAGPWPGRPGPWWPAVELGGAMSGQWLPLDGGGGFLPLGCEAASPDNVACLPCSGRMLVSRRD